MTADRLIVRPARTSDVSTTRPINDRTVNAYSVSFACTASAASVKVRICQPATLPNQRVATRVTSNGSSAPLFEQRADPDFAAVVAAVAWFLRFLVRHSMYWFVGYRVVLGTVVLIFVLVKAFTGNSGGGTRQGGSAPPPTGAGPRRSREILEERYARGEISAEEYREREDRRRSSRRSRGRRAEGFVVRPVRRQ